MFPTSTKRSIYHNVQDAASLNTASSGNDHFPMEPHSLGRLNTAKLCQLSCFKSLRKYAGNIHGMFVAGVVTKSKVFSLVLTLSK